MEHMELLAAVKDKKVKAVWVGKQKYRLFTSYGTLCYFKQGSRTKGYPFPFAEEVTKVDYVKVYTEEEKQKKQYKAIEKYRKYGEKTSKVKYGLDCVAILPKTYEQWVADGCKSLYEYSLTSGVNIEGKVITLDAIAKEYPHEVKRFRESMEKGERYQSLRERFRGYDMTLYTTQLEDGRTYGSLSLEYAGCGNGYYYALINEDCFIGYDID